jgi:serine/threonine protein kinase
VWEGVAEDGSTVALKFIPCVKRPSSVVVNEIRLLRSLRDLHHPHLIELRNVLAGPDCIILCMEKADGSLADVHRIYCEDARTHLPGDYLVELLGQAAEALDFLADQRIQGMGFGTTGLQHCDVKPSNLLLLDDAVKLADFGLCVPRVGNNSRGTFRGTAAYAPPELFAGRNTRHTDQFSLAVTYCELRCGRQPFPSKRSLRTSPDLSALPEAERPAVARALDANWLRRWPSCRAFVEALREAVLGGPRPSAALKLDPSDFSWTNLPAPPTTSRLQRAAQR